MGSYVMGGFMTLLVIFVAIKLSLFLWGVVTHLYGRFALRRIISKSNKWMDAEYRKEPSLLRGHDLVASVWYDHVRGKEDRVSADVLATVIDAGLEIQRQHGRQYDGRPIQQGWMTADDYDAYFMLLEGALMGKGRGI